MGRVPHQHSNSPLVGWTVKAAPPHHRGQGRKQNSTRCPEDRELDIVREQIHNHPSWAGSEGSMAIE